MLPALYKSELQSPFILLIQVLFICLTFASKELVITEDHLCFMCVIMSVASYFMLRVLFVSEQFTCSAPSGVPGALCLHVALYVDREGVTEYNFNFKYLLREDPQHLRVGHDLSVFISLLDANVYFYVTVGIKN